MAKRSIFAWSVYDFGNSIATMVFVLYFSQWMVIDRGIADLWYNLIFVISSVMLLLSAPITGVIADEQKSKARFLRVLTALQFFFLLIASSGASYYSEASWTVFIVVFCYTCSNYFYQFALIFYNSLLPDVSGGKAEGTVSGIGQFANWSGTVAGLALAIPFAHSSYVILGHSGRTQTFLPATIVSMVLTITPSLFLRETSPPERHQIDLRHEVLGYFGKLKLLLKHPGIGKYLLAFFFFNDAMLTVQHNMPIYMERVLGISDKLKSLILAGGLGAAALGGLVGGIVCDRIGRKRTLLAMLCAWTILLPVLSLTANLVYFTALALLMGFLFGVSWAVTRAVLVYLAPREQMNHAFSFYTLTERFATLVGPLTWGLVTTLLVHSGPLRYKIALFSMGIFMLIGLLLARSLPSDVQKT